MVALALHRAIMGSAAGADTHVFSTRFALHSVCKSNSTPLSRGLAPKKTRHAPRGCVLAGAERRRKISA
jgi:hypothetical protein